MTKQKKKTKKRRLEANQAQWKSEHKSANAKSTNQETNRLIENKDKLIEQR
nr:hypothetical protein [Mycoplasmopsis bovis]